MSSEPLLCSLSDWLQATGQLTDDVCETCCVLLRSPDPCVWAFIPLGLNIKQRLVLFRDSLFQLLWEDQDPSIQTHQPWRKTTASPYLQFFSAEWKLVWNINQNMTKNTKNGTREMVFSIISQYFQGGTERFFRKWPRQSSVTWSFFAFKCIH